MLFSLLSLFVAIHIVNILFQVYQYSVKWKSIENICKVFFSSFKSRLICEIRSSLDIMETIGERRAGYKMDGKKDKLAHV